jgi:murein DD-endopeptidase MepM/ murein hydrolase activator NlpD
MSTRTVATLAALAAACGPPPREPVTAAILHDEAGTRPPAAVLPPADYVAARDRVLAEARLVRAQMEAGDAAALFARFSAEMAAAVPLAQVEALVGAFAAAGGFTAVSAERAVPISPRVRTYVADVTMDGEVLAMAVAFDEAWKIAGLQFSSLPATPPAGEGPPVTLPFPAAGPWLVFWGGDDPRDNYHVVATGQRHAYDLVVWRDGSTFGGDGTKNEDYACFGISIEAPVDARVAEVVSHLPDNKPGEMDPAHAAGNHVMLEVAPGRFLLLGHLQAGSVVLRPGDEVRRGAVVGRCGNSGNTSEPHLHVHVQDRPSLDDPDARGVPLLFADVVVDGARLPSAAPARGRFVQRASR